MAFRLRGSLAVLLVVLLLLGAGLTASWFWAEGLVARQWEAQLATLRAQGFRIDHGPSARAGWPVALGLDVPDIRVELPDDAVPGGGSWRAERLAVRIEALHPGTLLLSPAGAQSLRLGVLPRLPYEADELRAYAPLGGGEVLLRARVLRVGGTQPVMLSAVEAKLDGAALRFAAERVELPGANLPPVAPLELEAALAGALPPPIPDPLRRLAAWRDAGGAAILRSLALRWGSLDARAEGRAALDARLQPVADGVLRLRGASEAVSALAASGYLAPGQATAVRAALALLSRPPPGGGPLEAELPVTLRDGILTVARIPVARVVLPGGPGG